MLKGIRGWTCPPPQPPSLLRELGGDLLGAIDRVVQHLGDLLDLALLERDDRLEPEDEKWP